eukprot:5082532-Amphidinium_carterae.1
MSPSRAQPALQTFPPAPAWRACMSTQVDYGLYLSAKEDGCCTSQLTSLSRFFSECNLLSAMGQLVQEQPHMLSTSYPLSAIQQLKP